MAGPFAFDKNAQDGDVVTLENGVTYQYDEAKDRWLVKDVAGSGSGIEYATLEHSDGRDDHLQTQIDELEQELDVIAPRLEAAQYTYSDSPAVKAGEMHVASGSFSSGTDVILFNDVALDGNTHTWAELQVGDYLEITDTLETRTAENYAMYLVSKAPEGTGLKQIDVTLVKGQGVPTVGDVMDAKGFQLGGTDINELDARYAEKGHKHSGADITSGTVAIARLPTGTTSSKVALGNHNHSGVYAPVDHTHGGMGTVKITHGYKTAVNYNHGTYGDGAYFIKYRNAYQGSLSEASVSTKLKSVGEVKFVSNNSNFGGKVGQMGLLIAHTGTLDHYYPYLVINIWQTEDFVQYGYQNIIFRGTFSWCRENDLASATFQNAPELYWTWHGDGK